jgi:hypothetical protein
MDIHAWAAGTEAETSASRPQPRHWLRAAGQVTSRCVLVSLALAASARVVKEYAVAGLREHACVEDRPLAVAASAVHEGDHGAVARGYVPAGQPNSVAGREGDALVGYSQGCLIHRRTRPATIGAVYRKPHGDVRLAAATLLPALGTSSTTTTSRRPQGAEMSSGREGDQAACSSAGVSSPVLSSAEVVAAAPGSIMTALTTAASAARAART